MRYAIACSCPAFAAISLNISTFIAQAARFDAAFSSVSSYYLLDDWTFGDGTAKLLLQQINALIHQYTPGKPSICGFGGAIDPGPPNIGGWDDFTADNFSPEGCDMVGLYIYADSGTNGPTYDWSMSKVLPFVLSSFTKRGWDITKEPLVGIPQAFGGVVEGESWPLPTAQDLETQTQAYCQNGAIGLIFYDWQDTESISNNAGIAAGVKAGVADCQHIWSGQTTNPAPSPTPSPTPSPVGKPSPGPAPSSPSPKPTPAPSPSPAETSHPTPTPPAAPGSATNGSPTNTPASSVNTSPPQPLASPSTTATCSSGLCRLTARVKRPATVVLAVASALLAVRFFMQCMAYRLPGYRKNMVRALIGVVVCVVLCGFFIWLFSRPR